MKALIDGPPVRICKVCDTLRLLEDFASHKDCNYGKTYTCKECMTISSKKHYEDNKPHKLNLANIRNRRQKKKAVDLLGGQCHDCHGKFHQCVYDFHHVDDTKEMNPSYALTMSWNNAVKELEKCILLCANCHRLRHFKEEE